MRLRRTISLSLRALFAHRLRASLAIASVSIGVAAVIFASGLASGAARELQRNIESLGTNLLVVRPGQVPKVVVRKTIKGTVTTLHLDDADAIEQLATVDGVAPGAEAYLRLKGDNGAAVTKVLGTTSVFPIVRRFRVGAGRFFDDDDNRAARRVVVLGDRVATLLFPDDDPVGRTLRIRGAVFEIIGVLERKGVLADGDEDNQVMIPIRTALRRVLNVTYLSSIFITARNINDAIDEVTGLLRERHRADDVEIQNVSRLYSMQKKTSETFSMLTNALAAIALFVGGCGILALMFMSVKERTPEIGLRVAVGARPRDILLQFLLESTLLALSGWSAGPLTGVAGILIVRFGTTWKAGAPIAAIVSSFVVAITIGLGFGALPARKASLVAPIEALLAE